MTPTERFFDFEELSERFEPPVLIVSTVVGRGMYTIGEAIRQSIGEGRAVYHVPVEELVPRGAVNEDLERYKYISNNFPALLYLVYKIPFFYYRKYLREKLFATASPRKLREQIEARGIKTVICVSHRPAFWVSNLKRREGLNVTVWGVLGEYGKNLGWKYQFWEQIDGFLSPVETNELGFKLPGHVKFIKVNLPARREYRELACLEGDADSVLLVCGFWGQGPIAETVKRLSDALPGLRFHAVCGENRDAYEKARRLFRDDARIQVHGVVPSLAPLLGECASVITKPGISTLLESHAARRKIFLLKGMPVAEDNNARFAAAHFGAEWFDVGRFKSWYLSRRGAPLRDG
jgi:hypothetical protein